MLFEKVGPSAFARANKVAQLPLPLERTIRRSGASLVAQPHLTRILENPVVDSRCGMRKICEDKSIHRRSARVSHRRAAIAFVNCTMARRTGGAWIANCSTVACYHRLNRSQHAPTCQQTQQE